MSNPVKRVFVSSTADDLSEHRALVREQINRCTHLKCVSQETFLPNACSPSQACWERISHGTDVFIGLIGYRRGHEVSGDEQSRSITELEHDWAEEANLTRLIFMCDNQKLLSTEHESDEKFRRQISFRNRIRQSVVSFEGFDAPTSLATEVIRAALEWLFKIQIIQEARPEIPSEKARFFMSKMSQPIRNAVERSFDDRLVDSNRFRTEPIISAEQLVQRFAKMATKLEKNAMRENDDTIAMASRASEYYRHAGSIISSRDTKRAVEFYEKSVSLDPVSAESNFYLAMLYLRLGDTEKALKGFRKVVDLTNTSDSMYLNCISRSKIGNICFLRGELDPAVTQYTSIRRAIKGESPETYFLKMFMGIPVWEMMLGEKQGEVSVAQRVFLENEVDISEVKASMELGLGWVYWTYGKLADARLQFASAHERAQRHELHEIEAKALCGLGFVDLTQGRQADAEHEFLEARRLNKSLKSADVDMNTQYGIGVLKWLTGVIEEADAPLESALALAEISGNRYVFASACNALGMVRWSTGELQSAKGYFEQAETVSRQLRFRAGEAAALNGLGLVELMSGALEKAETNFLRARDLAVLGDAKLALATSLNCLGTTELEAGHVSLAEQRFNEARKLAVELGAAPTEAAALNGLGMVAIRRSGSLETEKAANYFDSAHDKAETSGFAIMKNNAVAGLGWVEFFRGNADGARALWLEAREFYRRKSMARLLERINQWISTVD